VTGVGIVVLAAGRSTRFAPERGSKLLASVGGVPVVRLAVAAAAQSAVGEVVVVTGHLAGAVSAALAGLSVRVVHEPAFGDGMATSLRRGILALGAANAIMVGLGDQPAMRAEAYRRVAEHWRATGASIVVPRYGGSRAVGHPPLFAAEVFDEVLALQGDTGARAVIARDPARVAEVVLDWAMPSDVDTVEDLEALQADAARLVTPRNEPG